MHHAARTSPLSLQARRHRVPHQSRRAGPAYRLLGTKVPHYTRAAARTISHSCRYNHRHSRTRITRSRQSPHIHSSHLQLRPHTTLATQLQLSFRLKLRLHLRYIRKTATGRARRCNLGTSSNRTEIRTISSSVRPHLSLTNSNGPTQPALRIARDQSKRSPQANHPRQTAPRPECRRGDRPA
jgi:hypothetical protein